MPVGTLFPGSEARLQVMGGYQTDAKVQNPQLPNTGAGDSNLGILMVMLALSLMMAGYLLSRRAVWLS